jgi:AcrR family transcriptional regulator
MADEAESRQARRPGERDGNVLFRHTIKYNDAVSHACCRCRIILPIRRTGDDPRIRMTRDDPTSPRKGATGRRRTRLGRPAGVSNLREKILDAAEVSFAERGYAGTTLREAAESCGVTQALITYYFGTKQQLFEEVFLRRATKISADRLALLAQLRGGGRPLDIHAVVRAFFAPMVELRATTPGRAFIRLQARLHTEPPEISYPLRNAAYSESTCAYVDAFREVLPGLPEKDLYWRVTLMIGAYLYAFSDAHRLEVLSDGVCDPNDTSETLDQLTQFIVGGLSVQACPQAGPAPGRKAKRTDPS